MPTGAQAFLAISRQNSFGTATASWFYVPFVNESVTHVIETLVSAGIRATLVEGVHLQGQERGEGSIVMEPHPIEFGHFLRAALGQSSSTIQSSVAAFNDFKHVFHPRNDNFDGAKTPIPPYTLQLHRDFEDAFQFTDSIVTRLEMRIEGGDFVRATVNMISRTTSLMTKTTPSFISDRPWTWAVASLQIGGTAVDFVENMTIVFENAVEGVSTLAGRRFGKFGRTGFAQVLISGRLDLSNLNQYDEFVAASETNMIMHLAQNVSSGPYMTITVPRFRWSGIPVQVGGPGRIAVDFTAKGIHHVNSNTAIDFTLINTRNAYQ